MSKKATTAKRPERGRKGKGSDTKAADRGAPAETGQAPNGKKVTDKRRADGGAVSPPPGPSPGSTAVPPSPSTPPPKKAARAKAPVAFAIGVNANDKVCLDYGFSMGWKIRPSRNVRWNDHSISAMSRDVALLSVLEKEAAGKKHLEVLDWFGSPRNLKFEKAIPGCVVEWTLGPDTPIAGDAARTVRDARVPLAPGQKFDLVVVQDVYQFGTGPRDRLDPKAVKEILEFSRTGRCYVIARMFNGHAGADNFGVEKKEMVWFREGGLIVASPEPRGQWYAPHPDINWVQMRTRDGIDSSEVGKFGPYAVFRLARAKRNAQKLVGSPPVVGVVEKMLIRRPGVFGFAAYAYNVFTGGGYLVHTHTYSVLASKFSLKVASGQILDAAKHAVQESVRNDPEMGALLLRAPDRFMNIVDDTTLAVLYGRRTRQTHAYYGMRRDHLTIESLIVGLRGSTMKSGTWWTTAGLLAGAAGLGVFLLRTGLPFREIGLLATSAACALPMPLPSGATCILKATDLDFLFLRKSLACLNALSACAEEMFGLVTPEGKMVMAVGEVLLYYSQGVPLVHRVIPFLVHMVSYRLVKEGSVTSKLTAIAVHVGWNIFVSLYGPLALACNSAASTLPGLVLLALFAATRRRSRVIPDRWNVFLQIYRHGGLVEALPGVVSPIPPGLAFPAFQSRLEVCDWPLRGSITIRLDGVPVSPETALRLTYEDDGKNALYPVLVTNRLLWTPSNTARNLLVALLTRTHRDPFSGRTDRDVRHARWEELGSLVVSAGVFSANAQVEYTLDECARAMGKRGRRIAEAGRTDDIVGPVHLKKSVSLKWNETISAQKDFGSVVTMKPRPIVNLDPIFHARMSPIARSLSDHLHAIFDGSVVNLGTVAVRVHFAAGYNQEKLSAMSADFDGVIPSIAVSGDDSIMFLPGVGYLEADQTMFDQSQDEGPMVRFGTRWMLDAGLPPSFIDLVVRCCSQKYTVRKGRLEISGLQGCQMPTGVTTTTSSNSVNTIAMYFYFLTQKLTRPGLTLEQAGWELGFTVKVSYATDFGSVTFLKGWWRQTVAGALVWLPLPSACLKLGKVLNDPVLITRSVKHVRGQRVVVRDDPQTAVRKVAFCLSRSYGAVPPSYPIFGSFLNALMRCSVDPGRDLGPLEESWKPKVELAFDLDREEAFDALLGRYGITREEALDVEDLLSTVDTLPCYVEHPVFDKLCDVDY